MYPTDHVSNCKKAIFVTNFSTSYNDNRAKTIDVVEALISKRYTGWETRRTFTRRMIIKKLSKRDGTCIDYVFEAMDKLSTEGFGTFIVQPTHIMNGEEYDNVKIVSKHIGNILKFRMGKLLLTTSEDYDKVVDALERILISMLEEDSTFVLWVTGTCT